MDFPGPAVREVLYVEDNALNALLMQSLFERRPDLRLVLAADCAAGLRCAVARPPDLLLIDLRLPDGHGGVLLHALRALPGLATVPAVAVTAEATTLDDLAGFDGLWPKPLQIAAVLADLERRLPRGPTAGQPPGVGRPVPSAAAPVGAGPAALAGPGTADPLRSAWLAA